MNNKIRKLIVVSIIGLFLSISCWAETPVVKLETNFGDIVIELFDANAPVTVENFLGYVTSGFYNGLIFHRITKEEIFVVQGGSLDTDLHGKAHEPNIINESDNGLSNLRGTIAMARSSAPDSANSGFYINYADNTDLDRPDVPANPNDVGYCVFGRVINGMDVVDRIAHLPTVDNLPQPPGPVIIYRAELLGDLNNDFDVDFEDIAILGNQWLYSDNSDLFKITASDAGAGDWLGYAVAVDDNYAIIGAPKDNSSAGSAYIFQYNDGSWTQQAKLIADDGQAGDYFGNSVSISANHAIIGAPGDDDYAGAAYIFAYDDGNWTQQAKLLAYEGGAGDQFGQSVSISGDCAVVGAPLYYSTDAGAAFIYYRNQDDITNSWGIQAGINPSDAANNDNFGYSVSINGEYVIVGSIGDDPCSDYPNFTGSAYVYKHDGEYWTRQAKLIADDGVNKDKFGWSVSIDGHYAIVGAPLKDDDGSNSGSAYIFKPNSTNPDNWEQVTKLTASDAAAGDYFGSSVTVGQGHAIVGAYQNDDNGSNSGSAYIFGPDEINPDNWNQKTKLTAPDAAASDYFGCSVAIGLSRRAIIGAYGNDDSYSESGSAYIFNLCPDADIDGDCSVTLVDLAALADNWLMH